MPENANGSEVSVAWNPTTAESNEIRVAGLALNAELADHVGELILMVKNNEYFPGCAGMGYDPVPTDYQILKQIYLGVISGPAILEGKYLLELPVGRRYTIGKEARCMVDHNIPIGLSVNLLERDMPMTKFTNPDIEEMCEFTEVKLLQREIVVGTRAVMDHFCDRHRGSGALELWYLCRQLGYSLPSDGRMAQAHDTEHIGIVALIKRELKNMHLAGWDKSQILPLFEDATGLGFSQRETIEMLVEDYRNDIYKVLKIKS